MNKIKLKAMFELILIIGFIFSIYIAKPVNAESYGCCEKIGNRWCEPGYQEQCDQSNGKLFIPSVSCSNTDICKLGTCIVNSQCFANYPKSKCTSLNGQWNEKSMDKIADCIPGCCVVGSNCQLTTNNNCDQITPEGFTKNFISDLKNDQACAAECSKQDKGCCVANGIYTYGTRDQCSNLNGNFNMNAFCNSVAGSGCVHHAKKGCVDNSEDLYWFDSCGNQEDLAETCDYPNKICATDINDENNNNDKEESICRSLDCVNTYDSGILDNDGGTRLNGESWCEYQSPSGPGMDLPGSVHYRHYCIDGVEYAVNCGNARNEMCMYGKFTNTQALNSSLAGLPDMGYSQCKDNRWESCARQNKKEKCENTNERDCMWTGGNCIPLVAPGFTKDQKEIAKKTCNKEDMEIDVLWESKKECSGDSCYDEWGCKENCQAFNKETLKSANFFCMAQGDCGATKNVIGEYTKAGLSRDCHSGEPGGAHVNEESCITKIDKNLWDKFYGKDFSSNQKGLNFGSVDANEVLNINALLVNPNFLNPSNFIFLDVAFLENVFKDPIGAINQLLLDITGISKYLQKEKSEELKINCHPWWIPQGGKDCWKCSAPASEGGLLADKGGDIIKGYACQKYTCEKLGSACKFVENTIDGSVCIQTECRNVLPPIIKPDVDLLKSGNSKCCTSTSDQFQCSVTDCSVDDNGANVGYDIIGNVNEMKEFTFGIETVDESGNPLYTECAYSDEPVKSINDEGQLISGMDTMTSLSDGLAAFKHNITFSAGYLAALGEKEFKYYLRCRTVIDDGCSEPTENPTDYVIRFNLHQGPDTTVPLIDSIEPANGLVANDKDTKEVKLRINEILTWNSVLEKTGGCKWSSQNSAYDAMPTENVGLCTTPGMYESQECSFTINNLVPGKNTVYFACSDPAGNIMSMGKPYDLIRTDKLNVALSLVSDDCVGTDCYTNNVTLRAETSGGAESGRSTCYFSQTCQECLDVPFYSTNSSVHEQILDRLFTQSYTYYVNCLDAAENIASSSIQFSATVDNTAPKLVSVNHDTQYDKLRITIEDENPVKCYYSDKEFSMGEGKEMTTIGDSLYAEWGLGLYYIRCEDKFGNEMPISLIHTSSVI